MAEDPYRYFRIEARELCEQLAKGILELEKGTGGADGVSRLFRVAHTLKGAARVVRLREIADLAHALEDALSPLREGAQPLVPAAHDALLRLTDQISALVSALDAPAPAGAAAARPAPREDGLRIARAGIAEMDALLDGVAETQAQLASMRKSLGEVDRAQQLAELLLAQIAAPSTRDGRTRAQALAGARALSLAEELRATVGSAGRGLSSAMEQTDRELRQVRGAAEGLRLLPAAALFTVLERAVRDAAQTLGRRVRFEARGGEIRLDAQVLAQVQPALVQLARNAVAHGIEPEAERVRAGKPGAGHVRFDVVRHGNRVGFACQDDGRGVDLGAVRRAAEQRGALPASAGAPDEAELLRLLLAGGISTSSHVTEVSGRGVGLDVVRAAAERVGGEARMRTRAGTGTTVELRVPVSLAAIEALVLETAGVAAAIPLEAVRRAQRIAAGDLAHSDRGSALLFEGQVIPLLSLRDALGLSRPSSDHAHPRSAVVVAAPSGQAAIGVERLLGVETVVLRPLPALAAASAVVAGSTLDEEGNPQPVLDPEGLVRAAQVAQPEAAPAAPQRLPILVIDDSLTTRMLEQSILESAGYEVELAISAEEALQKARARRYGLFLVDVEMPGMDGFEFVERAGREPELRGVPSVLVTSRNAPEDRRRGQAVGARGYIVKSEFDQAQLMRRIKELLG